MTEERTSFPAGIDFDSILRIISKEVYDTPFAFIRENVQNAVDAVRIRALRDGVSYDDGRYRIDITVEGQQITVKDNGIGMSPNDLQRFFWTIGASGKRTAEALAAGCVGTFGIGGFANFGVCATLEVISQTGNSEQGTLTRLSEADIRSAGAAIPRVTMEPSHIAAPGGTVVIGQLREVPDLEELRHYLVDFVRFVPVAVYFNGDMLSQTQFTDIDNRENYVEISGGIREWRDGDLVITGRLFEDRGHALAANIEGLHIAGESANFVGMLRFENGVIDVFKHGFKLCASNVGSTIGVSGRLDCDRFVPTAGRDSLDPGTTSLLGRIVATLEKVAIEKILETPERIAQHTRIFQYVVRNGLVDQLGNVMARLADGSESTLGNIRDRAEKGGIGVFYGVAQKQALNQIMQARGHLVVLLSSDRNRQNAERQYLEQYCSAKPFDGMIDCAEHYQDLTRFERVFLSELESNISRSYEIAEFHLVAGKLTEDIPVFLRERSRSQTLDIFVDVRHSEITKLEALGYTGILYSLISTFCHEYLGPSLKKWSPRFFGDGALNLDLLSRRRSELWILVKDDIGEIRRGTQRQVVTRSDVRTVNVSADQADSAPPVETPNPRILRILDEGGVTDLAGYYIRVPDMAFRAYGDLLQACQEKGLVWAGNKVTYVASDGVSAAFQYEIRLDGLVVAEVDGYRRVEGAVELTQSLQEMFEGIYFPIPSPMEPFLVPTDDREIRLELRCDWIDMRTAKYWLAK